MNIILSNYDCIFHLIQTNPNILITNKKTYNKNYILKYIRYSLKTNNTISNNIDILKLKLFWNISSYYLLKWKNEYCIIKSWDIKNLKELQEIDQDENISRLDTFVQEIQPYKLKNDLTFDYKCYNFVVLDGCKTLKRIEKVLKESKYLEVFGITV